MAILRRTQNKHDRSANFSVVLSTSYKSEFALLNNGDKKTHRPTHLHPNVS